MTGQTGRVMVLGWDSSDFDLITPWMNEGYLPNLKKLIDASRHGKLRSVYPPMTAMAWSTIVTGKNAAKHGVNGFMSFKANSYKYHPMNASARQGKDVWELLSEYGKEVAVVGVPLTFPVRKVNGCAISGFLTPNESVDYCFPTELRDEIRSKVPGYSVNPSHLFGEFTTKKDEDFVKSLFDVLQKHIDGMIYIAENKSWDFFMGVFNETDWVQHRFWSVIDKNHPKFDQERAEKFGSVIRDVHIKLDDALGELLKIADDASVLLVSDHGAGPLYWNINTTYLLYELGKVRFKKSAKSSLRFVLARMGLDWPFVFKLIQKMQLSNRVIEERDYNNSEMKEDKNGNFRHGLIKTAWKLGRNLFISPDDVDWSKTVAFSPFGNGQIFVNLEGHFPMGIVKKSEYAQVRQNIINDMLKLRFNDSTVMENVFTKDDLFSGKYIEHCPDIILHPNTGYFALGGFYYGLRNIFVQPPSVEGSHSMYGIIVLKETGCDSSSRVVHDAELVDIVPTILHMMQVPIPSDVDGKSLAYAEKRPPLISNDSDELSPGSQIDYTKEEEEDIEERLRSLGYI